MATESDTTSGIKRDWIIRKYQEGDEEQLYELRKAIHPDRCGPKETWLEWFHWQYKEYPGEISAHVAEANGKIIGHVCLQIFQLKVADKNVKARISIDLAVHPDYRKLGVGADIFKFGKALIAKHENFIGYGMPNRLGYQHALKQGYVDIGCWRRMLKVLNWEQFLSEYVDNRLVLKMVTSIISTTAKLFLHVGRAPEVDGLVMKEVASFDGRINEFLGRVLSKFNITVIKNRDYLNWRYATFTKSRFNIYIAEKFGTICGYLVLGRQSKEHIKEAMIYELIAESEPVACHMLAKITDDCRKNNLDLITWVGLTDGSHLRAFKKQGFASHSRGHQSRFVVISNHPAIPLAYLTDRRNWLIQRGDRDN